MTERREIKFEPVERIILSLLGAPGPTETAFEPIPGQTWLQKEVFVVLRNLVDEESVKRIYEPHRQGMYSEVVDNMLTGLVKEGFVKIPGGNKIVLTDKGRKIAHGFLESGKQGVHIVQEVKQLLNGLTYPDLIIYVYSTYPGWGEASEVKGYLRDRSRRLALAERLYKAGQISAGRAAQIAGTGIERFVGPDSARVSA